MKAHPKLGREIRRIKDQINSWAMRVYEPWMRRQRERHPSRYMLIHEGDLPNPGKLAIYLVYQPKGLGLSTLRTLQHFQQHGYAVFLVSNAPLDNADLERARPHCWKLMERNNFGYDFGGYQDAIRHMWSAKLHPTHLVIINDSIWFPLHDKCDLLERMEQSPSSFTGAFQLEPTRRRNPKGKKRPFMGSFFWHFKQETLETPAFAAFWNDYKATSSKYATIRRGERRFTHHMQDAGVSIEGLFSRHQFDEWLNCLEAEELKLALSDLCTTDHQLNERRQKLLLAASLDTDWKMEALTLAKAITESQNIMATAPIFMVREMGLPFLKKAIDPANLLALECLTEHSASRDWIDELVLSEITIRLGDRQQASERA